MTHARFSKAAMTNYVITRMASLSAQAEALGLKGGFDPNNGYAQVQGRGEELNRLYGQYIALDSLSLDDYYNVTKVG